MVEEKLDKVRLLTYIFLFMTSIILITTSKLLQVYIQYLPLAGVLVFLTLAWVVYDVLRGYNFK